MRRPAGWARGAGQRRRRWPSFEVCELQGLVLYPLNELPDKLAAALKADRPPDLAFGSLLNTHIPRWAFEGPHSLGCRAGTAHSRPSEAGIQGTSG